MITELDLPYPPSINHYFSYCQGRPVLSKDARSYRHEVRRIAISAGIKPFMGALAVRIDITPSDDRRRDCDNVQKAVLDALQHAGAFWDDSQVVWFCRLSMHLGDKLEAIRLAASWLVNDGLFVANLDSGNLCPSESGKGQRKIVRFLRDKGFEYVPAKHLLKLTGHRQFGIPFTFRGADDSVGPNYTKQPVVNSYYE